MSNVIPKVDMLPERDSSRADTEQGIFRKFEVTRTDGSDQPGGKHFGCEYFVLDVGHDPYAKAALAAYAFACMDTHPELAADIFRRYAPEQSLAHRAYLRGLNERAWNESALAELIGALNSPALKPILGDGRMKRVRTALSRLTGAE